MENESLIQRINTVIQNYKNENSTFCNFWQSLIGSGDFYIIGGAIRSIYNNTKPRDIDIIIKNDVQEILTSLDDGVAINRNYYGGYKIDLNGIVVDVWDFENHWAFKNGILSADEKHLAESCFFDFDALVYSPTTGYLNIDHYLHAIESHMIDFIKNDRVCIERNPGELTNVIRAIVAANEFNLSFSTAVATYIKSYLDKYNFTSLKKCEYRHYKEEKISFKQFNRILQTIT
jgi:hypothetical protein